MIKKIPTARDTIPKWAAIVGMLFIAAVILALSGSLAFAMQVLDVWSWEVIAKWMK